MADEERFRILNEGQLRILKQGVGPWNTRRQENVGIPVDLHGANLIAADLRETNLSRANLGMANLNEADLSKAHFFETLVSNADLL